VGGRSIERTGAAAGASTADAATSEPDATLLAGFTSLDAGAAAVAFPPTLLATKLPDDDAGAAPAVVPVPGGLAVLGRPGPPTVTFCA